ncbi:MAG TPA: transporter substrate-binding domain-containing protein [Clostridia bacterium]|nr:transporter substrate-binding domain-containing protein [Clostridia bacterium]
MMKKIRIFVLIFALGLGLVACGSTATTPTSENSTESGVTMPDTAESFLRKENLKIAVQAGTVGDFLAQELVGENNVDQYQRYVDAISAVKQGKVNGAIMDLGPAQKIVETNPDLKIFNDALTEENYAFGIKKGNTNLVEAVNAALSNLSESGELQAIFDKYINGEEGAGDDIDLNVDAKGGKLIMGTESGFAPYEMRKGDTVVGIDVEIMAAVAKAMDKELVIEDMQFASLIAAVHSGKIDIIAAGLTVTDERQESIDFSRDYVVGAKQVLVVKSDN